MSQGTFYLDQKPVLAEIIQSSLLSVSHGVDNQSRSAILGPNYQQCVKHTRVYFFLDKWTIHLDDGIAYFPYPVYCD